MTNETKRLYGELDSLADYIKGRNLGAAETPVLFAHAAGLTIGANLAAGTISREDAERSIEALRDHMRAAAGLDDDAASR